MSKSPFSKPATTGPTDKIEWAKLEGALIMVEPFSLETGINTSFGAKDAVKASVHVIDGPLAGTDYPNALIFGRALYSQLASQVGAKVLGRVGKGFQKPGQAAPYVLVDPTEDDEDAALVWLAARNAAPLVDDLEAPF